MTCKLSVNLNAVALLRNRRDLPWPSVVDLGRLALGAGAAGAALHAEEGSRRLRRVMMRHGRACPFVENGRSRRG